MKEQQVTRGHEPVRLGLLVLLAGMAGGLAEILWVVVYGAFSPVSATEVARQVTASLFPAMAASVTGAGLGFAIHMTFAVTLGYAFAYLIWKPLVRERGPLATFTASVLMLAIVWALNFFVVLPALNPVFITLMPQWVAFASKMWFAVAMGGVLTTASRDVAAVAVPFRIPVSPRPGIR